MPGDSSPSSSVSSTGISLAGLSLSMPVEDVVVVGVGLTLVGSSSSMSVEDVVVVGVGLTLAGLSSSMSVEDVVMVGAALTTPSQPQLTTKSVPVANSSRRSPSHRPPAATALAGSMFKIFLVNALRQHVRPLQSRSRGLLKTHLISPVPNYQHDSWLSGISKLVWKMGGGRDGESAGALIQPRVLLAREKHLHFSANSMLRHGPWNIGTHKAKTPRQGGRR